MGRISSNRRWMGLLITGYRLPRGVASNLANCRRQMAMYIANDLPTRRARKLTRFLHPSRSWMKCNFAMMRTILSVNLAIESTKPQVPIQSCFVESSGGERTTNGKAMVRDRRFHCVSFLFYDSHYGVYILSQILSLFTGPWNLKG